MDLVVPPQIRAAIPLLRRTQRFLDPRYPQGVIKDNVLAHECRCVLTDLSLGLPRPDESQLVQTHWWHDYPEAAIVNGFDLTAVQKVERPELGRISEEQELAAARELLGTEGLRLFENFQEVGRFLHGEAESFDPISLLAKIIDFTDGNLVFHYFISRWVGTGRRRKIPPATALEYTFSRSEEYRRRISEASFLPYIKELCLKILTDQIDCVKEMWQKIETDKVPPAIARFIF